MPTEAIYIFVLASVNRGALPQIEDTAASQFVVPLSEKMGTGFMINVCVKYNGPGVQRLLRIWAQLDL